MKKPVSKTATKKNRRKQPQRWLQILVAAGALLIVCATIAIAATYGAYTKWRGSDKIAPHYFIQGENVSGLTPDVAKQRLQDRFGRLFVTLHAPGQDYHVSLSQLGGKLEYDYAVKQAHRYGRKGNLLANLWQFWFSSAGEKRDVLPLRWKDDALRKTMWTIAYTYNQKPRDASLKVKRGVVSINAEQQGRRMEVPESIAAIKKKYFPGLPEVTIPGKLTEPTLRAAQLEGQDVLLGKYSTRFNPGVEGRTVNVHLAATAVEGKVLMPGDVFSFNRTTGERTPAKGYQVAKIFVKKPDKEKAEIVDGVGGGVCQVSSTLYNAVRRTNGESGGHLKIVERNHHSLPVTYVPEGLDATVAWPYKDFRFRNRYSFPIYLRTAVGRSTLTISVWGRIPNGEAAQFSSAASSSTAKSG